LIFSLLVKCLSNLARLVMARSDGRFRPTYWINVVIFLGI